MPRYYRVTALVMSFSLANLAWVGSGFACDMTSPAGGVAMAGMDMAGNMAGMDMAGMDMTGTTKTQSGEEPAHQHAPCDLPWAPGGCQSMAPCAPIALASIADPLRASATIPVAITALVVLTPPSIDLLPELPPPRA